MGSAANYTQVKISIDHEIAAAFKKACAVSKVSMASVLSDYMARYGDMPANKKAVLDLSTRRRRRNEVRAIVKRLEQVREAEECYRDNVPDNLQGSMVYERAEQFISLLEEALDLLEAVE